MRIQLPLVRRLTLLGLLLFPLAGAAAEEPKQWQTYDGYNPEGYGRHIVFVSGDEEYRSEEALPMLAKIMAVRHGFKCTVLFAQDPEEPGVINPQVLDHIPGLEALRTADLMVIATRFRALPDEQMEEIDAYLRSGRPVVGLRTANHGFRFPEDSKWHHYSWQYRGEKEAWEEGFGGLVLGSWFFSHHGWHRQESTRGIVEEGAEKHEILRGIEPGSVWGPTDVYGVKEPIPGDGVEILLRGQVLAGMNPDDEPLGKGPYEKAPDYVTEGSNDKNDPMQALAWTKSYRVPDGRKGRAFCTTLGASTDFEAEGTRRLVVNAMFWCLGMDIPEETDVEFVDPYEPSEYRTHPRETWEERQLKVSDFDLQAELQEAGGEPQGEASLPYLDVKGGRDGRGYAFADHPRNRHRLYNFYERQAEFYLDGNEVPDVLPPYPGLEAGTFGHWGKFHKNSYKDRRWNLVDRGNAVADVLRAGGKSYPGAIAVRLDDELACAFDPETLEYTHVWKGGFVSHSAHRWGIGSGITPDGEMVVEPGPGDAGARDEPAEFDGVFHGYYRDGERVVFHFTVDGTEVWQSPFSLDGEFATDVEIAAEGSTAGWTYRGPGDARLGPLKHEALLDGSDPRYANKTIALSGEVGEPIPGSPFAIDRIPVPHHNEFGSLMFLGGLDFFSNGDAAVCSIMGDVWRVGGLDETLEAVTWTRIATGLNQALGLGVLDDEIYVIGRGRITRLHDLNGDGEINYYENFCDDFPTSDGGHDFYTGLQRDGNGYLYFVAADSGVIRVAPDGSSAEIVADGLRNANGVGVSLDGLVTTSTNEGDWTPASAVFEVRNGDFYGRHFKADGPEIAPAMCYLPRGLDNSSGGQVFCDSADWGPLQGQLFHFSYGAGTWMMILRDTAENQRTQGAAVPLPGDFASGAHRGKFHPEDGHLYVAGADGWGSYAAEDGSFDRIRYTGADNRLPVSWQAHRNGILVEFAAPVDPAGLEAENFFAQAWNYEYADAYGSLEYSLARPETPGHDPVPVTSIHAAGDGGKRVFVEMPGIVPAMQMQLHGRLKAADGDDFTLDMYPTVLWLRDDFTAFEGYEPGSEDKPAALTLRVAHPYPFEPKHPQGKPGRKIDITAAVGLQYEEKEIHAKPGEALSIAFRNLDTIPHNWVLADIGSLQAVGREADLMLADPGAAKKHHVPETDMVLHYTPMLNHNRRYLLNFTAPEQPGRYPYLCTYPGHWAVMNGVLVVESAASE
ncbi:MAG: DUF6797 domain-containing protein [Verrucomicrobiales bacterium]